jgi:S1-C subfamily serine protease
MNRPSHPSMLRWIRRWVVRWLLSWVFVASGVTGCASMSEPTTVGSPRGAVVAVHASGCPTVVPSGTGVWVGSHVVITAAHVVAGSTSIMITDPSGRTMSATPIAVDRAQDVAVLRLSRRSSTHLRVSSIRALKPGRADVALVGDRVVPVSVLRTVTVNTSDIDGRAPVSRPGYEIAAGIVRGDSGAPLLIQGQVVGIVWSRSVSRAGRAWVVQIPGSVKSLVGSDGAGVGSVSTGACL